jgi:HEPN domain-containing protein
MRQEVKNWWEQSKKDLHKAEVLYKTDDYDGVAFYCQQSVEKALKAVIILKTKENVFGHSLVHLGKTAKITPDFSTGLRKLSPQYFLSRYPDASEEVPFELYDKATADEFLSIARGVLEWTEKQLA